MSTKCGKPSLGRIQGCVTGRVKWSYWSGGLKYWIKRVIVLGKLSETVRLAEWGVTQGVLTGPLGRILSVNGVPSGTIGQSKRFATMNRSHSRCTKWSEWSNQCVPSRSSKLSQRSNRILLRKLPEIGVWPNRSLAFNLSNTVSVAESKGVSKVVGNS